jgi:hypothetical protein
MAATTYRINKKLALEGTDYAAGTEAELDLPDELRDRLIRDNVIRAMEAPDEESAGKKAK